MINETRQRLTYVVSDLLSTSLAWLLFNTLRFYTTVITNEPYYNKLGDFLLLKPVLIGQLVFPLMMLTLYYLSGYYNRVFFKSRVDELMTTLATASIGTVIIFFTAIINDPIPDRISNYWLLLIMFACMFSFVYIPRLTITMSTRTRLKRGELSLPTLIVGTSQRALRLKEHLDRSHIIEERCYNVVGFVAPDEEYVPPGHMLYDLPVYPMEQLPDLCQELRIKALIITPHRHGMQSTLNLISALFPLNLPILLSPDLLQVITSKPKIENFQGECLINVAHASMAESTVNLKRMGDICFSAVALLLLAPIFAAMAVAIKRDSHGPVFYTQERVGLRKKPFRIWKFRTMHTDAESDGPRLSSANDPRITPIGRFLRKYRLDELPQFWNVLKGDMSIIGPRPEREHYIRQIVKRAPYYTLIHQVRPGITSLGMVKYGYAGSVDDMIERLQYDLVYIDNVSLATDLKILLYTINTVINGRGV